MKFAKKLYAIIESGMPGTSTPLKNFGINPIKPENIKDLLLYFLFIKKIVYSPRGGLITYGDNFTSITTTCHIEQNTAMSNLLKETIKNTVSFFKETNYDASKIEALQKQIKKINLANEEIDEKILKRCSAEIIISPPNGSKNLANFTKEVFPFVSYQSGFFIKDVLHDLLHYVINPRTVTKFNKSSIYGGFSDPIGYEPNEFLEEVPALITDFFLSHLLPKDKLKKDENNFSKIINFKILYKNPGSTSSNIRNPLFFNILRYIALQKQLKKELNGMDPKEIEEIKENPVKALAAISADTALVSWNEILDTFEDYPNFKKILNITKKIVLRKIETVKPLLEEWLALSLEIDKIDGDLEALEKLEKLKDNEKLELLENKKKLLEKLKTIKTEIEELNKSFQKIDNKTKSYYNNLITFHNNLSQNTNFKWSKSVEDTAYEIFDIELYKTLQSSSNFLQKIDKDKKLEPIGKTEDRLNDFLNFVGRAIVAYNKIVTSIDTSDDDDF